MPCLIDEFAVVRACIVPEPVKGEDEASSDSLFEPNSLLRKSPDIGSSCEPSSSVSKRLEREEKNLKKGVARIRGVLGATTDSCVRVKIVESPVSGIFQSDPPAKNVAVSQEHDDWGMHLTVPSDTVRWSEQVSEVGVSFDPMSVSSTGESVTEVVGVRRRAEEPEVMGASCVDMRESHVMGSSLEHSVQCGDERSFVGPVVYTLNTESQEARVRPIRRGVRGRGARARARVSLRRGRMVCWGECATGLTADACTPTVFLTPAADAHFCPEGGGGSKVHGRLSFREKADLYDKCVCIQRAWRFVSSCEGFRVRQSRVQETDPNLRGNTNVAFSELDSSDALGCCDAQVGLGVSCGAERRPLTLPCGANLALLLQKLWRGLRSRKLSLYPGVKEEVCAPCLLTQIEVMWTGAHKKKYGSIKGHVRYLQWLFRAAEILAPGAWGGGMGRRVPKFVWHVIRLCRRHRMTKCNSGRTLASDAEFEAQRRLSEEMLDWYGQYPAILRKLSSNMSPGIFDDFCGGGAVGEGIRRAGCRPYGLDLEDQPDYKRRFAGENFTLGDGVDWSLVRGLQKRFGLRIAGASPPCKFYSTARQKGESKQPPLIERTRDMLDALFDWWWIENVMGAQGFMSDSAVEIDGPFFGLKVFRSRLFETNFKLHVDTLVRKGADRLRQRCCLGKRNRWRSFDEFGRPYLEACCQGNVFIPIGVSPWRCTASECSLAMGVDVGHMSYDRLAQAVPPAYSQWVVGQLCMRVIEAEFGCPVFTFDEMKSNPALAKRVVAQLLVGVGADRPSAGMSLMPRIVHQVQGERGGEGSNQRVAGSLSLGRAKEEVGRGFARSAPLEVPVRCMKVESHPCPHALSCQAPLEKALVVGSKEAFVVADAQTKSVTENRFSVTDLEQVGSTELPRIDEATFRELYYSHFGGYDLQWSNMGGLPWLSVLRDCTTLRVQDLPSVEDLVGHNSYLEIVPELLGRLKEIVGKAIEIGGRGTRATVVTSSHYRSSICDELFEPIDCATTYGGGDALEQLNLVAAWTGKSASPRRSSMLVHAEVRHAMDPRDLDGHVEDKLAKQELTWSPISHDANLWRGKGMPADVEAIMTEGVRIDMDADRSCFEVPQYPYPDEESLLESLMEADRALMVGHMEYVPDEMVESVVRESTVHPWLMVWQGKWRLCQDYSEGTNRAARSGPFGLPSVWDAKSALKPGSYMSKYDLRDFFWSIPVHPDSRKHLVMRHPGTGRLMWCRALPFGYLDSPRQSCRVSEALANEMRKRAAGKGIHFFCYVDDYLVIGDDYELTLEGNRIFEEVMREFGMQWAPSKHRGPVQCIEFLGLLLCNFEGHRCIALTEKRQQKLKKMIAEWLARKPALGRSRTREHSELGVEPVELAQLLGHLVFASQVVPGGRTYMQNMLSSFGGLEVDWKHGRVRPKRGAWDLVRLARQFWIDLEWWSDHLESRNCISLEKTELCEAMITGTDASDWGVGTVVWLDGHKEECNMAFTMAEKRRPINFRELLGIVRIVELYGHRLRGCKVLIETDNMAARGAAEKLSSVAASMQEMIRRLYAAAEYWDITIVPIHTPGAKLFRPDQTSRGDPIEEPRLRLTRREFALFESRYGPFTEFVGAERRHAVEATGMASEQTELASRLWLHPAHNTVGSALRLIGERMAGYDGDEMSHRGPPPSGIMIVPYAPEAHWWKMTRHFTCVGRWEIGSSHLEMNQLGRWKPVRAQRPSLALAFPRLLGGSAKPVEMKEWSPGYVYAADDITRGFMLPLPAGSFLYSPGPKGTRGELLMVWHAFHPEEAGRELDEEGEIRVSCAHLLYAPARGKRSCEYTFIHAVDGKRKQGSFANDGDGNPMPFEVAVNLLWSVDHLVQVDGPLEETGCSLNSSSSAAPRLSPASLDKRKFTFDFKQAAMEVKAAMQGEVEILRMDRELNDAMAALELARAADGADEVAREPEQELLEARLSAEEAAAMKKVLPKPTRVSLPKEVKPVDNRKVTVCRYAAQRCEGCNFKFYKGENIVCGVRAMVHPKDECLKLAMEKHGERLAPLESVGTPDKPRAQGGAPGAPVRAKGTTTLGARFRAMTDGDRLVQARDCLSGCCQITNEEKLLCMRGCGRGVHLVGCLHTSANYAAAGRLICVVCRLEEILEKGSPDKAPMSLVQQVTLAMVSEVTCGAVSTAAGRNQFASLERRWQNGLLESGNMVTVKLPRHNIESFCAFMWWLVTDADRARSFATTMRAAGAVMSMLELQDWTKSVRIKSVIKEIQKQCSVETEPCTQTTRRLIKIMIETTIEQVCSRGKNNQFNHLLAARTLALLMLELLAGLRVGEATSSGDFHGLDANDVHFLTPATPAAKDGLGETIEVKIKDSKTGPGRHSAFVSTTEGEGKLEGGAALKSWVNLCGLKWDRSIGKDGGLTVLSPNYWVVRLSLASLTRASYEKLSEEIENTEVKAILKESSAIRKYLKERYFSKNLGVEQRYVNMAGGHRIVDSDNAGVSFSKDIVTVFNWLEGKGFGAHADIVPGPFVRATLGYKLTHMPMSTASTYTHLVEAIKEAYVISKEMDEADLELDLQGLAEPHFGNHSLRRHADKLARESLHLHAARGVVEVTKELIDYFFGWLLKEMEKIMQLHYAGLDRPSRRSLARVTMFF